MLVQNKQRKPICEREDAFVKIIYQQSQQIETELLKSQKKSFLQNPSGSSYGPRLFSSQLTSFEDRSNSSVLKEKNSAQPSSPAQWSLEGPELGQLLKETLKREKRNKGKKTLVKRKKKTKVLQPIAPPNKKQKKGWVEEVGEEGFNIILRLQNYEGVQEIFKKNKK